MKLSYDTIDILRNFSMINESIIFHKGNQLNTTSNVGNVKAFADIKEKFTSKFAIYNLNQFIGTLELFEDPDVECKDTHLLISDDSTSVKFFYADESIINIDNVVPKLPETTLEFVLTKEDLAALAKAASVLNLKDLILSASADDSSQLELRATDYNNPTSNTFGRMVGDNPLEGDFNFNFKTETLKIIPGDYTIKIAGKKVGTSWKFISHWERTDNVVSYFIALDPASTKA